VRTGIEFRTDDGRDACVDTSAVERRDRGEYWQDSVARMLFPLDTARDHIADFHGRLRVVRLGSVVVARVAAQAHSVHRTAGLIRDDERGTYKISLQLRGPGTVAQNDREASLGPGDMAIYDTDRPYSLRYPDDMDILIFMFPRERLRLRREHVCGLTATRIPGREGLGAVVAPYLAGLAGEADRIGPAAAVLLADSVVDLVAGLLVQQRAGGSWRDDPGGGTSRALLMRAKTFIDEHLADPDLDTQRIARELHLSPRSVQRLFSAEGTGVAEWVRQRRLEQCRKDLADPAQARRPVSAVGAQWGMPDSSHFSRVFKAAYGRSPRDYRADAGTGQPLTASEAPGHPA
jgi:AraC-like DNA-binding protein